jgi:hypothetical protein
MLKSLRKSLSITFALLAMTALAAPAYPQESARPQESPWAMRAPAAVPHGAPTLSAQQRAAQEAAERGTPEQQAFARKVADAMSSKDFGAMKQLIAPNTLKCIGPHQDFLQDRINRQLALPISTKYKLTITKLPANVMNASKYATYPMPATHLMGMDFADNDNHDTVNLPIGQEGGKWYEVQPCPTEAGMVRFAKMQHMKAQAHDRAKAAVADLKDPVKSQLLALVGKRDAMAAWKLCMSSLHYDFPTCRGMVAILAGEPDY